MIEKGTITALDGDKARVSVNPSAGCAGCASKSHCATESGGKRKVTVINGIGAEVGDRVEFVAKSGNVLLSAALVWLFPIFAMIVGYVVGEIYIGGGWAIACSFGFLVLAGVMIRILDRILARGSSFLPAISRILSR